MTRVAWIAVGIVSAVALGLAVALAVSLAGGDDPEAQTSELAPQLGAPGFAPPEGGAPEEFLECMEEQGVEPPSGLQQEAPQGFEEAMEACRDLLPEGADLRIAPPG
jgi:hypothetical protein